MDDNQSALRRRFPVLTSLRIFHEDGECEDLAAFMGILLAAMEGAHGSSLCFVFPRRHGLATLSAALYALGRFAVDFPKLAEQYAQRSFTISQRVRLIPGNEVFEFGGVWPGSQAWFRLKLLDDKRNTAFTWPISEILRIEPTARKIPKGREDDISRARREAPLSTLDRLTGTRTFGNLSLAVNHVLLLGGHTEIEDFLVTTSLTGPAQLLDTRILLILRYAKNAKTAQLASWRYTAGARKRNCSWTTGRWRFAGGQLTMNRVTVAGLTSQRHSIKLVFNGLSSSLYPNRSRAAFWILIFVAVSALVCWR